MASYHGTERSCNWCGPSSLADSDPDPSRLCVRHQAAYYERRSVEAALEDDLWWNDTVEGLLREGAYDGALAVLS